MNASEFFAAVPTTWPPAGVTRVGAFDVPMIDAGGNRVSAARLSDPQAKRAEPADIDAALAHMAAQSRAPLFQVLDSQPDLATALDARGLIARDHTDILVTKAQSLAAVPPAVTAFDIWPPLAIQTELWEAGGIDAARRAVMDRCGGPKTSLFGRTDDTPAGVAFVALHGDIAMLHALEIVPALRRRGLATHMMRAAAHWATQHGAKWISVLVTQQNHSAQGLYASLGLQPVGTYHYREVKGQEAP